MSAFIPETPTEKQVPKSKANDFHSAHIHLLRDAICVQSESDMQIAAEPHLRNRVYNVLEKEIYFLWKFAFLFKTC